MNLGSVLVWFVLAVDLPASTASPMPPASGDPADEAERAAPKLPTSAPGMVAPEMVGSAPALPPELPARAAPPAPASFAPAEPLSLYQIHLAIDLPAIGLGAGLGALRAHVRDSLARKSCPCDPASLNPIDRRAVGNHNHAAAVASDVTFYVAMLAPVVADLIDVDVSRPFAEDALVFAETLFVASGVQNVVELAVSRPRPVTYAGDPKFVDSGEGYLSFYAGHVSTAFAAFSAASFTLGRRHGQRVWPWIVTALVGGSVAVERVASGNHFPTDVTAGAIVGTAIGVGIPWLHTRELPAPVTIAPTTLGGPGLALAGRF